MTSSVTPRSAATTRSPSSISAGVLALPVILLGAFVATGGFFVVNVALPTIGRELSAEPGLLPLVVAGYSSPYAALQVAGGRLGDRFGRRRLFVIGAFAYAVASLLCAAAPTFWALIAARVVQGTTAALFAPQVLSTIQTAFGGPVRERAMAWFGSTLGLAAVAGQLLGGVIAERGPAGLGWRAIFVVVALIAVVMGVLATRFVPETTGAAVRIDPIGAILLVVSLVLLLLPLSLGVRSGWPPWTWVSLAAVLPAIAVLIMAERRIERSGRVPLVPLSLFTMPAFRRGLVVALAFFLGLGGFFLVIGFILQGGLGLGPLESALVLTPYALAFLAVSLIIPRLTRRFGARVIVLGALVLALADLIIVARAGLGFADLTGWSLVPELILAGVGQSLVMIPVFGQILARLPGEQVGAAAGVLTTTQQIGIALGAAGFGALLFATPHGPAHSAGWAGLTMIVFAGLAVLAVITGALAAVRDRE